ncbi:MAG: bifunctional methylenetetrahydrofolate dehydrogenase/methenyltetrahydrofolate cyclohydrolase FolD [Deltaproteobacteria bacterium]|nr:bifunctional methylenetetrahydrofolate dehydrogenase/methenyltetrahydrofolate cyclohydrolase FolD [Deltaproteobacteria bacterium]
MSCLSASNIINGKDMARGIRERLKAEVAALKQDAGITPGLAVILVGQDAASSVYVSNKKKACDEAGIRSFEHRLATLAKGSELAGLIAGLNEDTAVHGILVQLPLPKHMDTDKVVEFISPEKDVDGFHPYNMGRLVMGNPLFEPCTPMGIMELIKHTGIGIEGKEAVVVGRSNIVGKPIALMLLKKNATVTMCHSKTRGLKEKVLSADIVIAAIGKAGMIKGDWIKQGAVVIDVGINRTTDGRLVGNVDFEGAKKRAGYITPVPGGVGPMTIAMLLKNTVASAKRTL